MCFKKIKTEKNILVDQVLSASTFKRVPIIYLLFLLILSFILVSRHDCSALQFISCFRDQ